jgi:hypothetical protein
MAPMDDAIKTMTDQVTADTTVEASAITLLNNLSGLLLQFANSPAKITDLANQLKSNSDALATAVTANTPAA